MTLARKLLYFPDEVQERLEEFRRAYARIQRAMRARGLTDAEIAEASDYLLKASRGTPPEFLPQRRRRDDPPAER